MIYVLHGENQVASRKRLQQLRESFIKNGCEVIFLNGKAVTLEQVNLHASTSSILGNERLVVVEEFFSTKKTKGNLALHPKGVNLIFWEPRELSKTLITGFPKNWRVENFPIPQVVFKFLALLMPGKPQGALRILQTLEEDDAFSLLPLLSWHVRYLIWASSEPSTLNLPSWRKQKLVYQASKFTVEKLYDLHQQILSLDRSIKTGMNVLSPVASLELLVANL